MNAEEILIVGAGPAGVATSLFLSQKKVPHTIIDKASFPRDKICGDALSGKVVHVLNKLDPKFVNDFTSLPGQFTGSYGICFFAPNGKMLEVPFSLNPQKLKNAPGFISRRLHFDEYLFKQIDRSFANVKENTELIDLTRNGNEIIAKMKSKDSAYEKKYKYIIGAEGDRSVVAKKLDPLDKNLSHYCAALRGYYKGVTGTHSQNFIELHFLKDLLPGYFWIFPMSDGTTNVGIGMLSEKVAKRKINLRNEFENIISNHPVISKRFEKAISEGPLMGWGLPLGSAHRSVAGDNYLLTGDAGSLIDPFTGEGIGNALFSGMLAAETLIAALAEKRHDKAFLYQYELKLYKALNDELRISNGIQKLSNYAWLFNLVVGKAIKNKTLRETITCMFDDLDIRAELRKPSFYFKLIFN
jgi:geranylgeranyl reductase family protein